MIHNGKLTKRAQELRKNMTQAERHLWYDYLNQYPMRFRRQITCGRFILDFYCAAARLCVEVDGSQHYEPAGQQHDRERTAFLEAQGIRVIRFSNADVMQRFRGVCEQIDLVARERAEYFSRPKAFPIGEGGTAKP